MHTHAHANNAEHRSESARPRARAYGHPREDRFGTCRLEALIAREAATRLALLGGTQPKVSDIPRAAGRPVILADTSVWIEHFRKGEPALQERLSEGRILMHPWISGELAC